MLPSADLFLTENVVLQAPWPHFQFVYHYQSCLKTYIYFTLTYYWQWLAYILPNLKRHTLRLAHISSYMGTDNLFESWKAGVWEPLGSGGEAPWSWRIFKCNIHKAKITLRMHVNWILCSIFVVSIYCSLLILKSQYLTLILVASTHTLNLILNERMCEKTKIAIYLNLITLTDRQIPLVHLTLKAKLLVQLKVTLSIKTIKIYRPRARSELAIRVSRLLGCPQKIKIAKVAVRISKNGSVFSLFSNKTAQRSFQAANSICFWRWYCMFFNSWNSLSLCAFLGSHSNRLFWSFELLLLPYCQIWR